MDAATDTLALWRAVEKTDPAHTKQFKGKGGFSGTAISPMYLIHRATKQWGPMGTAWGIKIIVEKIVEGAPIINEQSGVVIGRESIHQVQAEVWYPGGAIPCFGQTQFVGRNKYGWFTDEEAPKKSLTDALTKGLSWLGFAADVHMGKYDDVKYVNRIMEEFQEEKNGEQHEATRKKALAILSVAAEKGTPALELAWRSISNEMRTACKNDLANLKTKAKEHDHAPVA